MKSPYNAEYFIDVVSVDSLSPLLFIIILIPLSLALNSTSYGYLILKETPINHLLHVDDMKLYGKTEREWQSYSSYSLDKIERYWREIWNGQMQYCAYKEKENIWYGGHWCAGWTANKKYWKSAYKYLGINENTLHKK